MRAHGLGENGGEVSETFGIRDLGPKGQGRGDRYR